VNSDTNAALHLEAGPNAPSNPFTYTGLYIKIDWSVAMDVNGNPVYSDPESTVEGRGSKLPIVDIALVLEDGRFTVY